MTDYEQLINADLKKMGTAKGWCLKNVTMAFDIHVAKYASAKAEMEAQRREGTLHPIDTLPTNVCVPVYVDTASPYEHVVLSYYGTFYSDGKKISRYYFKNYFGWGEKVAGIPVVKATTMKKFLPARGYWCLGDIDDRVGILAKFMRATFPAYTSKHALGNIYGKYLKSSIVEFQKRTGLYPDGYVGAKTYAKLKEFGFKY